MGAEGESLANMNSAADHAQHTGACEFDEWADIVLRAALLKPTMRTNLSEDIRWLFNIRLMSWLHARSEPIAVRRGKRLNYRNSDAVFFEDCKLRYETGIPAHPHTTINAEFCLGYGFDDFLVGYSQQAINYGHHLRDQAVPASYVSVGPKSLGNFAVVLDRKPVGFVCPLPGELRSCGMAEIPYGKTRSLQAWLGVWFDRSRISARTLDEIEALPDRDSEPHPHDKRHRYGLGSPYGSIFMQYYGRYGDDEVKLRESMGFRPKGSPGISEEILYRSVCEIFGAEVVKRRYRGRELERLEIDVWVPARKLGFEYQGEQHWARIAHWHGEDGFETQQLRDARKKELFDALGYRVLYLEPGSDLRRESIVTELRMLRWLEPEFVISGNDF